MKRRKIPVALGFALALASPLAAAADETESLKSEVEQLKEQNRIIMERLEATADMLESMQGGSPTTAAGTSGAGHDHAMLGTGTTMRDRTFGIHGSSGNTTVGGYGELHYNNWTNKSSDPGAEDVKEIDLHRFILFMGHEFTDRIRFWSELEVEHAYVKDTSSGSVPGEVSIEQAFLEFDLTPDLAARAGVLLIPVGFINETHEPPTFYGVERPNVEKYIIPTTWREGGAGLTGRFGQGFSYDVLAHSGLMVSAPDYKIRGGRTGAGEAPADDLAATARLNWAGMPGLQLGVAGQYQSDITQGTDPQAGSATLLSGTLVWQVSRFTLRGLYATWRLSGNGPRSAGADEQTGWYLEPSWLVTPKLGVFARYSEWDNSVNSPFGPTDYAQIDAGFNYWPHENVVLKFNYQDQSAPTATDDEYDGFSLGVGYMF